MLLLQATRNDFPRDHIAKWVSNFPMVKKKNKGQFSRLRMNEPMIVSFVPLSPDRLLRCDGGNRSSETQGERIKKGRHSRQTGRHGDR